MNVKISMLILLSIILLNRNKTNKITHENSEKYRSYSSYQNGYDEFVHDFVKSKKIRKVLNE